MMMIIIIMIEIKNDETIIVVKRVNYLDMTLSNIR